LEEKRQGSKDRQEKTTNEYRTTEAERLGRKVHTLLNIFNNRKQNLPCDK